MIGEIHIKVCGLTTGEGASLAQAGGADYLGFNFYPKSRRFISIKDYRILSRGLPQARRVAVVVEPTADELSAMRDAGLEFFQVHFRRDTAPAMVETWSRAVGPERLWLAPKLPPHVDVSPDWLSLAQTFLLDTFDETLFGGTGRTGDWSKFVRHRDAHAGHTWILSGGLNSENIAGALRGTGARFVDVNSGVESAPGVKDAARIAAFAAAVQAAVRR